MRAAEQLGAQTVVVHPPFRWQRRYAEGFSEQVAELEARSEVMVAVENMFPFRADRFFGTGAAVDRADAQARRYARRGASRRSRRRTTRSTASMPTTRSICRIRQPRAPTPSTWRERMGDGLVHLHLCDGSGAVHRRAPGARPRHPADRRDLPDAGRGRLLRPRDPRGDDVAGAQRRRTRGAARSSRSSSPAPTCCGDERLREEQTMPMSACAKSRRMTLTRLHPVRRRDGADDRGVVRRDGAVSVFDGDAQPALDDR